MTVREKMICCQATSCASFCTAGYYLVLVVLLAVEPNSSEVAEVPDLVCSHDKPV